MRQTKASHSSQLYAEHQTIYTLRLKKSHMSQAVSHKDKLQMADKPDVAKACFSKEAQK